jgi:DsbC/DsbD-like thiol-disulfide interchange protein
VALEQALTAGDGTPDPGRSRLFEQARAALPAPLAKPVRYAVTDKALELFLPLPGVNDINSAQVFFDGAGIVAHGKQRFTIRNGGLSIIMARDGIPVNLPLSGVVRIVHAGNEGGAGDVKGYRFITGARKTK